MIEKNSSLSGDDLSARSMLNVIASLQPTIHMPLESRILFVFATGITLFVLLLCLLLALCLRLLWISLAPETKSRPGDEEAAPPSFSEAEAVAVDSPPPPSFREAVRQLPQHASELFVLHEEDLPPPYNLVIASK